MTRVAPWVSEQFLWFFFSSSVFLFSYLQPLEFFPGCGIRPSTRFEAARGERRGNREQRSKKEEDTEVEGRKETAFYFAVNQRPEKGLFGKECRADQRPEKGSLGEECGAVFRSAAQVRLALRWCSCAVLGAITEIWLLKKGDVLFPQQRQAPAALPLCSLGRRVPYRGVRTRFPTAVSDFWCKQPQRVRASGAGVV